MRSRYALITFHGWVRFSLDNERVRTHPATYYKYFLVQGGTSMAQCELCGNEYDKTFEVVIAGKAHVFDSFECAVATLAPTCRHCGLLVLRQLCGQRRGTRGARPQLKGEGTGKRSLR